MNKIYHVILTGGIGSRLWPLSRKSMPKQYLEIFSHKSLFELTIERNAHFADKQIVVGNKANHQLSLDILNKMGMKSAIHIVEATPRNTAAAIAFAALSMPSDAILLVTPADHIIEGIETYNQAVQKALELAKEGYLVTFGVEPIKPETGYGYIEFEKDNVIAFKEKPDSETAKEFLGKGTFLWNSGMFCFKAGVFLKELKECSPKIFQNSETAFLQMKNGHLELNSSMEIPDVSVDFAVMERSDKIKVVKAEFQWSDMGSFEAVYEYLKEKGQIIDVNHNMQMGDTKPTFFVGLDNCIFISTKDANLIVAKEASQDVKTLYQFLEKNNSELLH